MGDGELGGCDRRFADLRDGPGRPSSACLRHLRQGARRVRVLAAGDGDPTGEELQRQDLLDRLEDLMVSDGKDCVAHRRGRRCDMLLGLKPEDSGLSSHRRCRYTA